MIDKTDTIARILSACHYGSATDLARTAGYQIIEVSGDGTNVVAIAPLSANPEAVQVWVQGYLDGLVATHPEVGGWHNVGEAVDAMDYDEGLVVGLAAPTLW